MLRDGFSFGSRPQLYIHFFQRLHNPLHGGVDLFLAQGAVGGAQGNVEGHALLSRGNLLALVYVEQLNGFENLAAGGLNRFFQSQYRDAFLAQKRQIPGNRREFGQGMVLLFRRGVGEQQIYIQSHRVDFFVNSVILRYLGFLRSNTAFQITYCKIRKIFGIGKSNNASKTF